MVTNSVAEGETDSVADNKYVCHLHRYLGSPALLVKRAPSRCERPRNP